MQLSYWHLIPDKNGTKHYYYGDTKDFIEENELTEEDLKREIPFENYPADSYRELIDNYYEDINRHSMPNTTYMIDTICKDVMTKKQRTAFWRKYCEKLYADED